MWQDKLLFVLMPSGQNNWCNQGSFEVKAEKHSNQIPSYPSLHEKNAFMAICFKIKIKKRLQHNFLVTGPIQSSMRLQNLLVF